VTGARRRHDTNKPRLVEQSYRTTSAAVTTLRRPRHLLRGAADHILCSGLGLHSGNQPRRDSWSTMPQCASPFNMDIPDVTGYDQYRTRRHGGDGGGKLSMRRTIVDRRNKKRSWASRNEPSCRRTFVSRIFEPIPLLFIVVQFDALGNCSVGLRSIPGPCW
jgi:hypothetical protein